MSQGLRRPLPSGSDEAESGPRRPLLSGSNEAESGLRRPQPLESDKAESGVGSKHLANLDVVGLPLYPTAT